MQGKGSGAVNRVELECQVLCAALRQSWVRKDKVGAFTSIRELSHLFPDLLPPPEGRNGSNKANYYEVLAVRPGSGLNALVVGYLRTVRKFLKEHNPKDYRQFYNTMLNAGFVLRKPRLRLSHDLVVARRWLYESQMEEEEAMESTVATVPVAAEPAPTVAPVAAPVSAPAASATAVQAASMPVPEPVSATPEPAATTTEVPMPMAAAPESAPAAAPPAPPASVDDDEDEDPLLLIQKSWEQAKSTSAPPKSSFEPPPSSFEPTPRPATSPADSAAPPVVPSPAAAQTAAVQQAQAAAAQQAQAAAAQQAQAAAAQQAQAAAAQQAQAAAAQQAQAAAQQAQASAAHQAQSSAQAAASQSHFHFDESQFHKPEADIALPGVARLMEAAHLLTKVEVQALKAQMQLAPNVSVEQLMLNAGYATKNELSSLRLAQDLLSAGKINMAQFQVAMYDERTSGLRMAESLQVRGWLETEVRNPVEEFKRPGS